MNISSQSRAEKRSAFRLFPVIATGAVKIAAILCHPPSRRIGETG